MTPEQRILYNMIIEAQYMMVFNDLTCLPKVINQLNRYAYINDIKLTIKSKDLETLQKLSYLR